MVEEMGAQIARRVALVGDTNGLMFCAYRERKWMRKCLRASFGDVLIRWNPFVALDFFRIYYNHASPIFSHFKS
jgi:hypothetical protein